MHMKMPLFSNVFVTAALVFVLFLTLPIRTIYGAENATDERKEFGQFSVILPDGWDGDEQTGFISDNPEEYMLTLTRRDKAGDNIEGQVSIFLLPNKPGKNSLDSARALADAQGESTEPIQQGNFVVFEGEPRSNTVKGRGVTMVNATPERLLIIIAQDPQQDGANAIVESLRGVTPEAKNMLGR